MTGSTLNISWAAVIAIVVVTVGAVFLAAIFLVRAQRSRRLRVGVFVERDVDSDERES